MSRMGHNGLATRTWAVTPWAWISGVAAGPFDGLLHSGEIPWDTNFEFGCPLSGAVAERLWQRWPEVSDKDICDAIKGAIAAGGDRGRLQ